MLTRLHASLTVTYGSALNAQLEAGKECFTSQQQQQQQQRLGSDEVLLAPFWGGGGFKGTRLLIGARADFAVYGNSRAPVAWNLGNGEPKRCRLSFRGVVSISGDTLLTTLVSSLVLFSCLDARCSCPVQSSSSYSIPDAFGTA